MRRAHLISLVAVGWLLGAAACGEHEDGAVSPTPYPTDEPMVFDDGRSALRLPARADEPATITDRASGMSARFRLVDARAVRAHVNDATPRRVSYPRGAPDGGDVTMVAGPDGVEDFITFDAAPAQAIAYELDVKDAAGLRHVGRGLELLDDTGTPRLRVLPPWVRDADGQTHRAELRVDDCAVDTDPRPPWGRAVTPPGSDRCRLTIPWPTSVQRYPAVLDPAWVSAAAMDANRKGHTVSTVAQDHPECGDGPFVVVAGGFRLDNGQARSSVELYHPATGTWCQGPELITGRARHSATFVDTTGFDKGPDNPGGPRLVVAGGLGFFSDPSSFVTNYESLNLITWTWATGTIWLGRADHEALAANNGNGEPRLVMVGGVTPFGRTAVGQQIDVDAFLPPIAFGQPLAYVRAGHTMTRLEGAPLHRHLVVGGCSLSTDSGEGGGGGGLPNEPPCESWEIYCPFTGCSQEGDDIPPLLLHAATRTNDAVVVTGGVSNDFVARPSAWRFDIANGSWTTLPDMPLGRLLHTASPLADGSVLAVGGLNQSGEAIADAHRLVAGETRWRAAGELEVARSDHGASVLPSGAVIVMGGEGDVVGTAELYIPCDEPGDCPSGTYCSTASMACAELEPNGTPCLDAVPCQSGLCVDGFCCDGECTGECEACNVVGDEGDCSELPPSVAPNACLPIASCVDEVTFEDQEGNQLDCSPFRCVGGACVDNCNASTQCAPGFVCNPSGDCVVPPPSSGGSCATRPARDGANALAWLLLGAGLVLRSRRAGRDRG